MRLEIFSIKFISIPTYVTVQVLFFIVRRSNVRGGSGLEDGSRDNGGGGSVVFKSIQTKLLV